VATTPTIDARVVNNRVYDSQRRQGRAIDIGAVET
jgi:hypothetical protein